jgi:xanthine dehydrogenase/oxidase
VTEHPVRAVSFSVNGAKYVLEDIDPVGTLGDWLKEQAGLKGTKTMCKEGGCGACVVALTRKDTRLQKRLTMAITSCLFPLVAVDGCSVTTTDGIGNSLSGFHPIQERLAEHNGSQCGFCSPGMVMNMYSLLKENSKPTKQQIENSFDGNICRCTG